MAPLMDARAGDELPPNDVLIVEDDPAIRRLLDVWFTRHRLRVILARDGADALDALQRHDFAVLLLDLMMPRMSGWEVLDWLKEHPSHRPRSVIVVSAATSATINALDPSSVNAVVFKPFDVHELAAYVESCCSIPVERRAKRRVGAR
jgi:DNA-binding response OmpR family regulator